MILTTNCRTHKIVWVEQKYRVEPLDENHYKISKALYGRLLKIITSLEAKVELLELKLEKD
jgi:hypothetical protein